MPNRKKVQNVELTVKGRGKVTLKLTAEDEHTIYLEGRWDLVAPKDGPLVADVLGSRTSGKFERKKASRVLDFKDVLVSLQPVDSMHGLAYGGKGVAVIGKLGRQDWMAY